MPKKILPIFLLILIIINFLVPQISCAQYGLEQGEKIQGLSKSDPEIFVANIIKAVLLIIGVILIVLIIYGGITYATAMGNEQKLETAKKILVYAIIGVIIIALAYALTTFILNALFPKEEQQQKTIPLEQRQDWGGQEYTLQPPSPEQTCKKQGEKCLFSPNVELKDGVLYVEGVAIANPCCSGLDCDIESQECIVKCAKVGEEYIRETLTKRENIGCCQGLEPTNDPDNPICIKPRL